MAFRSDLTNESWLEKAKQDIPRVLRAFWERRIKNDVEPFSREGFKKFIKASYLAAGNDWNEDVDRQFNAILQEKNDFNKFRNFFGDWFTIDSAMIVDCNHCIQPKEKDTVNVSQEEITQLSEFLEETHKSAAITFGNAKTEFKTVLSSNIPKSEPFQIHSVTKIFTGTLILKMIEKNIMSENELKKPLSEIFDGNFLNSLPEGFKNRFQNHLSDITLFQLMTHQSGLGDYYEFENKGMDYKNPHSYQKAIIDSIATNQSHPEVPEIKEISDLLQFTEDKTYPIGNWHYSNVGITLVGIAIEYAYKRYKNTHAENSINSDFDSLLREYILKEAHIESGNFTKTLPPNGRYNNDEKADQAAPYITAGPAGYYWTTVEDLARFGSYFYDQYTTNSPFKSLVDKYGEEFSRGPEVFAHTGTLTSASSAFLSISKKGNIVAVVCDNSDEAANSLESRIKRNIFSEPFEKPSATARTAMALGIHPLKLVDEKKENLPSLVSSSKSSTELTPSVSLSTSKDLDEINEEDLTKRASGQISDISKKSNSP